VTRGVAYQDGPELLLDTDELRPLRPFGLLTGFGLLAPLERIPLIFSFSPFFTFFLYELPVLELLDDFRLGAPLDCLLPFCDLLDGLPRDELSLSMIALYAVILISNGINISIMD
jgi:hypothetical protein